jgi:hypothetical protein
MISVSNGHHQFHCQTETIAQDEDAANQLLSGYPIIENVVDRCATKGSPKGGQFVTIHTHPQSM